MKAALIIPSIIGVAFAVGAAFAFAAWWRWCDRNPIDELDPWGNS